MEVEEKQLVLKTVKLVSLTDVKSFTDHLHMTAPLTAMCVCEILRNMNIYVSEPGVCMCADQPQLATHHKMASTLTSHRGRKASFLRNGRMNKR